MVIKRGEMFKHSDVTPRPLYLDRRRFIAGGLVTGAAALAALPREVGAAAAPKGQPLAAQKNAAMSLTETQTTFESATTYNNFYEFGTDKEDPSRNAGALRTRPWTVKVEGLCAKPRSFDIEELLKLAPLEERIYSLRCVEAWSMVIPWIGYSLSALLKKVEPTSQAKFVEFITLHDPEQMPGQRKGLLSWGGIDWPYVEGLRMDEAMHPLTLLTLGMYGQVLPNQNGAPVRVIIPWKYGFKSGKSIVRMRLTVDQPKTAWEKAAPQEYGFYSNVNPTKDHPRWSQATERRIGEFRRRKTLPFNGYGDQVASLYAGMDLNKFY